MGKLVIGQESEPPGFLCHVPGVLLNPGLSHQFSVKVAISTFKSHLPWWSITLISTGGGLKRCDAQNRTLAAKEQAQKWTVWRRTVRHTTSPAPVVIYDYWPPANLALSTLSFFPSFPPFLSFGFNSLWFRTFLWGIRLWEKRLQESSLAQQTIHPWVN